MSQIKRAVTFYSFQDNYVRKKMSLDDIMSYVKNELQADMEFIPDQMLKGAPYSLCIPPWCQCHSYRHL